MVRNWKRQSDRQRERRENRPMRQEKRSPGGPILTKVNGVLSNVIMMSATARLTMKRLVAECMRWFLKMT